MSMKMGNCSRDTMADRAITSPKSFPKCSEGKLGRDKGVSLSFRVPPPSRGLASVGLCQPLAPNSLVLGLPSPSAMAQSFKPQSTEKALCQALGNQQGPRHRLCPRKASRKGQTHQQITLCQMMGTLRKQDQVGCRRHNKRNFILGELEQRALQGE